MFKLKNIKIEDFDMFYKWMEQDFCFEERRLKEDQLKLLKNPKCYQKFIYKDEKLYGYICYWQFNDFLFIEHFAILQELRDQGYGSQFLNEFLKQKNTMVIGEVERPKTAVAKRRISFYKRLGFNVNEYDYYQPPYHGNIMVPMFIISYNRGISLKEYQLFVNILHKEVYNIKVK